MLECTVLKLFSDCDGEMDDKVAHYVSEVVMSTS